MIEYELYIINESKICSPVVKDGVKLELERSGSPGKLTFSIVNDNYSGVKEPMNIQEGNEVQFIVNGTKLFRGFIFTKARDKEQIISITAYDQLRYLKNKDNKKCNNVPADVFIKQVCEDFLLNVGDITATNMPIYWLFEDKTIFDMFLSVMQETTRLTGEMYVLYDDFGKITLKNISEMTLDCLITENTAENFSYTSSIDSETYNQIKLVYKNEETGMGDVYMAKDSGNINEWGLLQYYENIDENDNGVLKAETMLSMYNSKRRILSVSGAFGDLRVRGGSLVPVTLTLGDVDANSYLLVEKVTHNFSGSSHTMDLELRGGLFE